MNFAHTKICNEVDQVWRSWQRNAIFRIVDSLPLRNFYSKFSFPNKLQEPIFLIILIFYVKN